LIFSHFLKLLQVQFLFSELFLVKFDFTTNLSTAPERFGVRRAQTSERWQITSGLAPADAPLINGSSLLVLNRSSVRHIVLAQSVASIHRRLLSLS